MLHFWARNCMSNYVYHDEWSWIIYRYTWYTLFNAFSPSLLVKKDGLVNVPCPHTTPSRFLELRSHEHGTFKGDLGRYDVTCCSMLWHAVIQSHQPLNCQILPEVALYLHTWCQPKTLTRCQFPTGKPMWHTVAQVTCSESESLRGFRLSEAKTYWLLFQKYSES